VPANDRFERGRIAVAPEGQQQIGIGNGAQGIGVERPPELADELGQRFTGHGGPSGWDDTR
jgi:hypothetical protein